MIGQLGNLGQLGLSGGSRQLTPRMVPGCMWEYDLYNWSTLFQDKNGTIPVTTYGQPIGLNLDLSGNNNHRFSESAARPTLELSASGKPCLYYPGTGRYMQTNPFAWGSDEVCAIVGVRKLTATSRNMFLEFGIGAGGGFQINTPLSATERYSIGGGGTASLYIEVTNAAYDAPITNLISYTQKISTPSTKLYLNGALYQAKASTLGAGNYGTYAMYSGARYVTGTPSLFFNGEEYSSCGFNKIPTDAQFAAMNRYINNKTGAY